MIDRFAIYAAPCRLTMWTSCQGTEAATPLSPTGGPLLSVGVGNTWCQVRGRADGDRAAAGRVRLPQGGGA